jgi:hypothetical protein
MQLYKGWPPVLSALRQQTQKSDVTNGSTGSPKKWAPGEPQRYRINKMQKTIIPFIFITALLMGCYNLNSIETPRKSIKKNGTFVLAEGRWKAMPKLGSPKLGSGLFS